MVTLRSIEKNNFDECLNLKVNDEQKNFVASNVYSLAQAWLYTNVAKPYAIYNDEVMVGFMMFGYYKEERKYWIWRFMIDKKYQNMGYGKQAMALALKIIKDDPAIDEVRLSYEPENIVAEKLYISFGFEPTGEFEGDEKVMRMVIKDQRV